MKPLDREGRSRALCLTALSAGLFLLFWLFPLTGDDWFREALGASLHSPLDLFRAVAGRWATVNGRILGNVLAYAAGSRPLLRAGMRTAFTLALVLLLARITGLDRWQGLLICAAGALTIPREMFCQIYPWAAGFFNYVPPVVLILAGLELARPVLDGSPLQESPGRGAALFLVGLSQPLFVENDALCALCAAGVLVVWYRWEQKRWSPCLLALLLGCVLGTSLLFASPSYRLIAGGDGAYRAGLSGGLSGLAAMARTNLPEVVRYYILACPVLYWGLTVLALLLWMWEDRPWYDRLLAAALFLSCGWLDQGRSRLLLAAALWWLFLTAALWRWLPGRTLRARALFLWLGAPVAAAPLLFVDPIGPRCLFLSYILMLAAGGVMLRALGPERLPPRVLGLGAIALTAAVSCSYLTIYSPLHQVEIQRSQLLAQALASGADQAVLPPYEHGGWLWDADSAAKMETRYYHDAPGDLKIRFSAPDQWLEV